MRRRALRVELRAAAAGSKCRVWKAGIGQPALGAESGVACISSGAGMEVWKRVCKVSVGRPALGAESWNAGGSCVECVGVCGRVSMCGGVYQVWVGWDELGRLWHVCEKVVRVIWKADALQPLQTISAETAAVAQLPPSCRPCSSCRLHLLLLSAVLSTSPHTCPQLQHPPRLHLFWTPQSAPRLPPPPGPEHPVSHFHAPAAAPRAPHRARRRPRRAPPRAPQTRRQFAPRAAAAMPTAPRARLGPPLVGSARRRCRCCHRQSHGRGGSLASPVQNKCGGKG
eukprot:352688-Chlamydomonas_euryale.AAC.4